MLEIKPCLDKQTMIGYCKKCKRAYSEAFYLYLATNRNHVLAAGLFEVGSEEVQAVYYESTEPQDAFLFDGILRAGLNYAAGQGIENGRLPEDFRQSFHDLFAELNYPAAPVFNITNFFQKYKNCSIL